MELTHVSQNDFGLECNTAFGTGNDARPAGRCSCSQALLQRMVRLQLQWPDLYHHGACRNDIAVRRNGCSYESGRINCPAAECCRAAQPGCAGGRSRANATERCEITAEIIATTRKTVSTAVSEHPGFCTHVGTARADQQMDVNGMLTWSLPGRFDGRGFLTRS